MIGPCTSCGRAFGGTRAYDIHLDRRRDRCRSDRALEVRGLIRRPADGVWVQSRGFNRQLRLWAERPGRPRKKRAQTIWGVARSGGRGSVRRSGPRARAGYEQPEIWEGAA